MALVHNGVVYYIVTDYFGQALSVVQREILA